MSWMDEVLALLCAIYKEFGGKCADLYAAPSQAPAKVLAAYGKVGTPTFPGEPQKLAFLQNLNDLEKELASPSNTFGDEDTNALNDMIAQLRLDLTT